MIQESRLQRLETVLDRVSNCEPLPALISSLTSKKEVYSNIKSTAIALDSSVFLRLATAKKGPDIIDFLNSTHSAPLILPGQSIQEFWNNQLSVVDTLSTSLQKRFKAFEDEVNKTNEVLDDSLTDIETSLKSFSNKHGHIYDEATSYKTLLLLNSLKERAIVPFVPRSRFSQIALQRKKTMTPPGFKDDGDGDFFIWADSLFGLLNSDNSTFDNFVLVTIDKKIDWSRDGVAHPILLAEVRELFNVEFSIWTIDQLSDAVSDSLSSSTPANATDFGAAP